jgi:hypothetical protein
VPIRLVQHKREEHTVTKIPSPHGTRTLATYGRTHIATCDECGAEVARGSAKKAVIAAASMYSSRHEARHKGLPDPYPFGGIW